MFVSSSFYFHMLYRGWVDYLIIKIPVSTWGLYDLKIGAKNQHNKIKFSTNRRGVTASAVFLLSFLQEYVIRLFWVSVAVRRLSIWIFNKKFRLEERNMEGNRPKRRKDKYNPYNIYEKDKHYYISFKDGQGVLHKLEISRTLYDAFDSFELDDLVYLNVVDRHIE